MAKLYSSLKWVFIGFISVVIILVGSLVGLNYFFPKEKVKPLLEKAFTDFLQRKLTIEYVDWEIFPKPTLMGHNVTLWEDDSTPMAQSPEVEIALALEKLRDDIIKIEEIRFLNPHGTLRQRPDKSFPLVEMIRDIKGYLKERKQKKTENKFRLSFKKFVVVNGEFNFIDEKLKQDPLGFVLKGNAHGEIQGEPGSRRFPYEFNADVVHSLQSGSIRSHGTLGRDMMVFFESDQLPVQVIQDYNPFVKNIKSDFQVNGKFRKEDEGKVFNVQLRSNKIESRIPGDFPDISISAAFSNEGPSDISISIIGDGSDIKGNFRLDGWGDRQIEAQLESGRTAVEEVRRWTPTFQSIFRDSKKVERPKEPWRIDADVNVTKLRYREEEFDDIYFKYTHYSTGPLMAQNIRGRGVGGFINGELKLEGKPRDYYIRWNVENVDMGRLMSVVRSQLQLTGQGSTRGHLSGDLDAMGWRGTEGMVTLQVEDGNVLNAPGVIQTLRTLNLTSLLKNIDGQKKMGFPFQLAKAKLILDDGIVTLEEPGMLESDTLEIALKGTANLNQNNIDATLVLNFLTVIDELVRVIPGAKLILVGNKKSIIPIFAYVKGDLTNPKINVRKSKTIREPLFSPFKRVLSLPKGLFESLRSSK